MKEAKQGMKKIHGFKYLICLSSSLSLNLFFLYLIVDGQIELTWTKKAAFEAEAAASILCSGHGRAFIDGNVSGGGKGPTSECFSCYGGALIAPSSRLAVQQMQQAYAWLRCEMEEETDCRAILKAAGIIGRSGSKFGFESRFVRLSLLKSKDDFNWLLQRITAFVADESTAKSIWD